MTTAKLCGCIETPERSVLCPTHLRLRRSEEPCPDRLAGVKCTLEEGHERRGRAHSGYDRREETTVEW